MNRQRLWLCCVLTALTLLSGWCLYPNPPSVEAQGGGYQVFLPLIIMEGATPTPEPPALYGASFIDESDLPELAALNVKLVIVDVDPIPQAALAILDTAESYGMHAILRVRGSGDWGWDGNSFDLSLLADFEPVIGGHPALFAVFGLHEPWERFTADQLRQFYNQWKAVAPSLALFHHFGHLRSKFTAGMADVGSITAKPHFWDRDGNPANYYGERTRRKVIDAQTYIRADPDAVLCVVPQAHGQDPSSRKRPIRMPTADEMRENAAIIFGEFGVTCGLWYPYQHPRYDHVLGDPEFGEQRQIVAETYRLYFAP